MQPGGKLQDGENPLEALARELNEELGCRVLSATFMGVFSAPAANEPLQHVEAMLFRTTIAGAIKPAAEIEQVAWVDPSDTGNLQLAPLTRDHVLPLLRSHL